MVSAPTPRDHIEALYEVSRALNSSLDLEAALAVVIDSAIRLSGAERGFLMLSDESGARLDFRIARNARHESLAESDFEVSRSVVQEVARSGRSVVTLDAQKDPRFTDKASVINFLLRSVMAVPLKVQGRLIGLLYVDSKARDGQFGQSDLDWLGTFADQAATAILNAQLYEAQKREAEIRRVLLEVARVAQAATTVSALTQSLAERLPDWMACDRCLLFLLDPDSAAFRPVAFSHVADRTFFESLGSLDLATIPLAERLRHERQPVRVSAAEVRARIPAEWLLSLQPADVLMVPIRSDAALIGVLILDNSLGGHPFEQLTLELADALGDQLATAIQRLQLFETSTRQLHELNLLNAVSAAATEAASVHELTERVMHVINPVFGTEGLGIMLLDEALQSLRLYPGAAGDSEEGIIIPLGQGIVGQVAFTGQAWRVPDVTKEPHYLGLRPDTRSELCVPLKAADRVIGVINVESSRLNAFTATDERLLITVAGQLATAIEKQRALETEREQRALAEALRDVGLALTLDTEIEVVLDRLLVSIAQFVAYDAACVMLVENGRTRMAGVRGYEQFGPAVLESVRALSFEVSQTPNLRRLMESKQPFSVMDVAHDPEWQPTRTTPLLRSWLGMPVIAGTETVAFISLEKIEPNFYRSTHASRLAAFAGYAALGLRNITLFQSAERRAAELDAVRIASLSLTSSLTVHEVLDAILAGALSLLPGAFHTVIYLYQNDRLIFGAVLWDDGNRTRPVPQPRPNGMTYTVAHTGEPIVVADMNGHPLFAGTDFLWQSLIGLPLKIGARVVGVMNVAYPTPRPFSEAELRILRLLGEQAAAAIENARLFDATRRQVDELTLLHAVAVAGAESSGVDALIERATQMIGDALRVRHCGVLLLEPNGLTLRPHASYRGSTLPHVTLGEGVTGRVASSGKAWRLPDVKQEKVYLPAEASTISELCVPLKVNDRVIGVINAESDRLEAFTEADERLLITVAGQLATAVEKTRLLEAERRAREQAETLREVASLLNATLERDELVDLILGQLARLVKYDSATVMLLDENLLHFIAQRGIAPAHTLPATLPVGYYPYIPTVIEDRRPFMVADTHSDPRWVRSEWAENVRCWLGVPLLVKEKVIGILNLDSHQPGFYTAHDAEMALALANQAAVALERLRLMEETQQRERELSLLLNLAQVASSSLEVGDVIQHVASVLARTLNVDACAISIYDPITRAVRSLGVHVVGAEDDLTFSSEPYAVDDFPLTRRVVDHNEIWSVHVNDADADLAERQLLQRIGCEAVLMMSVRASGRPIGLMELYSRNPLHTFTDSDTRLARAIADQTGVAMENARLFQAERDQRELAEALRNAAITLSANLDFDVILDRFLDQITEVLPYDTASVFLVDAAQGTARAARQRGYERFGAAAVEAVQAATFELATTPTLQQMAESGQPLVISDTAAWPGWIQIEALAHERSFAAAPVMAQGRVVAFFQLEKAEPNFYQPKHAERLAAFAGQAALAMQNAQLFETERRRVDALTALHDIGLELSAQLDLPALLKTLVTSAVRLLDTQMGAFYTHQPEAHRLELAASHQLPPYLQGRHVQVGEGLAGRVALSGEPLIIGDYQTLFDPSERSPLNRVRSVLGVPVQWQGQLLGAVTLIDERPYRYSEFDTEVVRLFADQAAIAIENVRLYGALAREKQRLELLLNLSQSLASTLNPQEVAERAMTLMCATTGAIRATIFALEPEGQVLRPVKMLGYSVAHMEIVTDMRLAVGQGITGRAAQTRKPVLAADVHTDPYWEASPPVSDEIRSAAALPLLAGDELVGVLNLLSDRERFITEEQLPLLTAAAVSVALALQNARLFEAEASRVYHLTLLNEITQVAVTVEQLSTLLQAMANRLGELVGADACIITLWDEARQRPALTAVDEADDFASPLPASGALAFTELVLQAGHSLAIEDVRHTPHFTPELFAEAATQSLLGLPLVAGDQKLGAALIAFHAPHIFTREEIRRSEQAAGQVALALARARLFDETRRNAEELALASELLRSLNVKSGVLREFEPLAVGLRALVKCQHVGVALLTTNRNAFTLVGASRASEAPLAQMQRLMAHLTVLADTAAGQSTFISDLAQAESAFVEIFVGTLARSLVIIPLRAGEQVIGALQLLWHEPAAYTRANLTLLGQIADALALAVEKDRLLDETLQRAQELEALTQVSAALRSVSTTREVLRILLQHSVTVFRGDSGAIFMPAADGQTLYHAEHVGLPAEVETIELPIYDSISGWVFRNRRPYLANDLSKDPAAYPAMPRLWQQLGQQPQSAIYAPLRSGEEVAGVLCISVASAQSFTETDLRLVSAIAEVGGSALQRARVLETLEHRVIERTHELANANERLKELDQLKDQFVSNVSHELRTPLTAIKLHLGLLEKRGAELLPRYLPVLQRETERLRRLIEDLLDLSRLRAQSHMPRRELHRLDSLLDEVIALYASRAEERGITIQHEPNKSIPLVPVDQAQLVRVFTNLIGNAVAYTTPGRSVTIDSQLESSGALEGVGIHFHNDGEPIPADDLPHLFTRFYRGQTARDSGEPGTGLGLAICKEIMQLHGGDILVASDGENGTTFTVWLPLTTEIPESG
ncbi:MAG: GAF domain-containing protein [Anaerolineales bacterium]